MPKILHITAHMGGGVGKVLSGVAVYAQQSGDRYQHRILMLEQPQKTQFIDLCRGSAVTMIVSSDRRVIEEEMLGADIVQLEWWHHPKMAQLLHVFPQVPVKLIIWSHVSGCNYPVLPFGFVKTPHRFLFSSRYSLENPYWSSEEKKYAATRASVVHSSGSFGAMLGIKRCEHNGFNIGYVGTLNYSKLHPDFISYCAAVGVPDARFIIVGDRDNQRMIEEAARHRGIVTQMEFTGFSNCIEQELARFDIFGYPLNPQHFGTTENAMLEAMASGLPVVALNQCAEKYIIKHMQTGLLVSNIQEYAEGVKYLYGNPQVARRIGEQARRFVAREFAVEKTVERLNDVYDQVSQMAVRVYEFDRVFGSEPYEWFLTCLGNERIHFANSIDPAMMKSRNEAFKIENGIRNCTSILREKSKSSIYHFEKYFRNDGKLRYWRNLLDDRLGVRGHSHVVK